MQETFLLGLQWQLRLVKESHSLLLPLIPEADINYCYSPGVIVGFFIPVSSLKVFGHSIHSERRRIYLGKSIQALQNDTIIILWVFSFRVIQPTVVAYL